MDYPNFVTQSVRASAVGDDEVDGNGDRVGHAADVEAYNKHPHLNIVVYKFNTLVVAIATIIAVIVGITICGSSISPRSMFDCVRTLLNDAGAVR